MAEGASPKRSPRKPAASPKKSPRKRAAKGKAGPKNGPRSKARPTAIRDHENMQNRVRYHLSKSKEETREAWKKATKAERKSWSATWERTGDFSHIQSRKEKTKEKTSEAKRKGLWFCKDKMLEKEGWTEANKNSEYGQRAFLRAEARISHCRRMNCKKEKWVDVHPQHGDEIFKCVDKEESENTTSKEVIGTNLSKSGAQGVVKMEGR